MAMWLRVAILVLTVETAVTHLTLSFPDPVFILNGVGYLGLLGLLLLPIPTVARYREQIRWLMIGYAALSIVAWLAIGLRIPIAYVNKVDELLLILALYFDARRAGFT